ncbi:MAG: hypothetical protein ACRERX_13220 [Pseudomonas sp.]
MIATGASNKCTEPKARAWALKATWRQSIVVCTNSSITDYVVTHLKQAPYRTFVVAARIEKDALPRGLYWDDADPYHYVRVAAQAATGRII